MRFVFVMDPIDRVHPELDTTFGFLQSAMKRGHECLHALIPQVEFTGGEVTALVRPLLISAQTLSFTGPIRREKLSQVDAVFIRKDPPFDTAYSYATLLLELLRDQTLVLNDPRGLRDANEKLYALHFPKWTPRTMVSADTAVIHRFVEEVGGHAVIKPLDGAGGFGVMGVKEGDPNARAIVDLLTLEGRQLAIVQEYLPAVSEGDKRVLMLDGQLLGAVLRVPKGGDLRANIHVGGSVVPAELNSTERELVEEVGERLRADGLYFVGLDLIGERLTEVNVTSPTGIRELGRFTGSHPSDSVIEWVERRVEGRAEG
jgi:glutathione synthase